METRRPDQHWEFKTVARERGGRVCARQHRARQSDRPRRHDSRDAGESPGIVGAPGGGDSGRRIDNGRSRHGQHTPWRDKRRSLHLGVADRIEDDPVCRQLRSWVEKFHESDRGLKDPIVEKMAYGNVAAGGAGQHQQRNRQPLATIWQGHHGPAPEPQFPVVVRALPVAGIRKNIRKPLVCFGMVRLQSQSRFVLGARVRRLAALAQRICQIDMAHRVVWMLLHGPGEGGARRGPVSRLKQQRAEVVQRLDAMASCVSKSIYASLAWSLRPISANRQARSNRNGMEEESSAISTSSSCSRDSFRFRGIQDSCPDSRTSRLRIALRSMRRGPPRQPFQSAYRSRFGSSGDLRCAARIASAAAG